jgi:hypothetical protein
MARQEGQQMLSHGNRPNARATAAMGNAKGFVQIEVTDIGAITAWLT